MGSGQCELMGGCIAGEGCSRSQGGALMDHNRGHKLGIGADEDIVFNDGAMFLGAVVVAGDGAGTNVDTCAHGGVPDIREVVGLAVGTNLAVLHLCEVADVAALCQARAWPQSGKGANNSLWSQNGTIEMTKGLDSCPGTNLDIAQHRIGTDLRAVTQHNRPLKDSANVDAHPKAAGQGATHIEAVWIDDIHASTHELVCQSPLEPAL